MRNSVETSNNLDSAEPDQHCNNSGISNKLNEESGIPDISKCLIIALGFKIVPKAKIVRLQYKIPLSRIFRNLLRRKVVVFSLSLLVIGAVLMGVAYNFHDVVQNPNRSEFNLNATSDSVHTVKFTQPYNVSEAVYFNMPIGQSVHYLLTGVTTYVTPRTGIQHTTFQKVSEGNVTDGSVIHINTIYSPSQNYDLNITALSSGQNIPVKVTTLFNVSVKEDTSKYIGGAGLLMIIGGAIILAYAVTDAVDRGRKYPSEM